MIHYEQFVLDNGLRVFVHEDESTPMAAVNILYNVGSRDENPTKTGFAHLIRTSDVWRFKKHSELRRTVAESRG